MKKNIKKGRKSQEAIKKSLINIVTKKDKVHRKFSDEELEYLLQFSENLDNHLFEPNEGVGIWMNLKAKEPRLGFISFLNTSFVNSWNGQDPPTPVWDGENYVLPISIDEIDEIEVTTDQTTFHFKVETFVNIPDLTKEEEGIFCLITTYNGEMEKYTEIYEENGYICFSWKDLQERYGWEEITDVSQFVDKLNNEIAKNGPVEVNLYPK